MKTNNFIIKQFFGVGATMRNQVEEELNFPLSLFSRVVCCSLLLVFHLENKNEFHNERINCSTNKQINKRTK